MGVPHGNASRGRCCGGYLWCYAAGRVRTPQANTKERLRRRGEHQRCRQLPPNTDAVCKIVAATAGVCGGCACRYNDSSEKLDTEIFPPFAQNYCPFWRQLLLPDKPELSLRTWERGLVSCVYC